MDIVKVELKTEPITPEKSILLPKQQASTPDRSPIRGLPFSPSQVSSIAAVLVTEVVLVVK